MPHELRRCGPRDLGFLGARLILCQRHAHEQSGAAMTPKILFLGSIIMSVLFRVLPLLDLDGRLLRQWPTEDGYLTLTIARNIALGNGFSVADGTVVTNGTQPLATVIYALGFWLCGASTVGSLLYVQLVQTALAVVAAELLRRFTVVWLKQLPRVEWVAAIAGSIWCLGPILVPHTMNCLETGLVIVLQLVVLNRWYGVPATKEHMVVSTKLGPLFVTALTMGLLAWSRVDNAFFLAALALVHLGVNWQRGAFRRAFFDVSIMALVTVVMIFPWLLFGKLEFGHWVPISGIAEGHFSRFGENLLLLPSKLAEYAVPVVGIPHLLEVGAIVPSLSSLLLGGWILVSRKYIPRATIDERAPLYFLGLLVLFYGGYYGMFFGAGHFLSRYLAPLATFTIPVFCSVVVDIGSRYRALGYGLGVGIAALLLGQQVRLYFRGDQHPHFQVVDWVRENVPDDVWVGAIQTGTLGFYHPRTINFDGKVDSRALLARLSDRHHAFIVESDVQAIVDWAGVAKLARDGHVISDRFYPLIVDKQKNLSVLIRKGGSLDRRDR